MQGPAYRLVRAAARPPAAPARSGDHPSPCSPPPAACCPAHLLTLHPHWPLPLSQDGFSQPAGASTLPPEVERLMLFTDAPEASEPAEQQGWMALWRYQGFK